jgi:hypothetical protein
VSGRGRTFRQPSVQGMNRIIAQFCSDAIKEPLSFFSEADLQGFLFASLIREFPVPVQTSYAKGPASKGKYCTGLVHREYGVGGSRRMDIAVFSPRDVARIDGPGLKIGQNYMRPEFGIELGTEKTKGTRAHIEGDIKKLSKVGRRGYLIHFFRDVTRSDSKTASREATEMKIKAIFRQPVSFAAAPDKVRVLCFLLRLARTHRKVYGKCEMFLPKEHRWKKINLQEVRGQVMALL